MLEHIKQRRQQLNDNIKSSYIGEYLTATELEKSATDFFEKGGRGANIGEIRKFGGREYIKTPTGWKFHGKGTGVKTKGHIEVSRSHGKEEPKDDSVTDKAKAMIVKDKSENSTKGDHSETDKINHYKEAVHQNARHLKLQNHYDSKAKEVKKQMNKNKKEGKEHLNKDLKDTHAFYEGKVAEHSEHRMHFHQESRKHSAEYQQAQKDYDENKKKNDGDWKKDDELYSKVFASHERINKDIVDAMSKTDVSKDIHEPSASDITSFKERGKKNMQTTHKALSVIKENFEVWSDAIPNEWSKDKSKVTIGIRPKSDWRKNPKQAEQHFNELTEKLSKMEGVKKVSKDSLMSGYHTVGAITIEFDK